MKVLFLMLILSLTNILHAQDKYDQVLEFEQKVSDQKWIWSTALQKAILTSIAIELDKTPREVVAAYDIVSGSRKLWSTGEQVAELTRAFLLNDGDLASTLRIYDEIGDQRIIWSTALQKAILTSTYIKFNTSSLHDLVNNDYETLSKKRWMWSTGEQVAELLRATFIYSNER